MKVAPKDKGYCVSVLLQLPCMRYSQECSKQMFVDSVVLVLMSWDCSNTNCTSWPHITIAASCIMHQMLQQRCSDHMRCKTVKYHNRNHLEAP